MKYLFLILMASLVIGCNNSKNNFKTEVAVPVSVKELELSPIKQVFQTSGMVASSQEISFKTLMNGEYQLKTNRRTGQPFRMGDAVLKGECIIELIDKEYRNKANIEGAKLDFEIAEMEYQKQKALYEKGGVTLRELVNGERSLTVARQNYENAEINLAKMFINAPFEGVITSLPYYSQNVRLDAGTDVLALMDYRQMILDLNFSESYFQTVKVNQPVIITNYSTSKDTISGSVIELSPAIDKSARTFAGRVLIENKNSLLRPGMLVKCEIELMKKDSVLVVPKEILQIDGNNQVVFVAERETALLRVVTVGIENSGNVEIVDGLKAGERVVVSGYETLRNKSKIKIVK